MTWCSCNKEEVILQIILPRVYLWFVDIESYFPTAVSIEIHRATIQRTVGLCCEFLWGADPSQSWCQYQLRTCSQARPMAWCQAVWNWESLECCYKCLKMSGKRGNAEKNIIFKKRGGGGGGRKNKTPENETVLKMSSESLYVQSCLSAGGVWGWERGQTKKFQGLEGFWGIGAWDRELGQATYSISRCWGG